MDKDKIDSVLTSDAEDTLQPDLFLQASPEEKMLLPNEDAHDMEIFFANLPAPLLRDEQNTMSYPFFSLDKSQRIKPIIYEKDNVKITVRGLSGVGIGSIWDADFLIWIASQYSEARRKGKSVARRFRFKPYHFLTQTGRMSKTQKGGKLYKDFENMLRRLKGTTVETNIKAGGEEVSGGWSWINYWAIRRDKNSEIIDAEVIVSEWYFRKIIEDKSILSIDHEYFNITGGIARWLYRIARKHCGSNDSWSFKIETLYEKYPSDRDIRKFRYDIKQIAKKDALPEYHVFYEETDKVTFVPREGAREKRKISRYLRNDM